MVRRISKPIHITFATHLFRLAPWIVLVLAFGTTILLWQQQQQALAAQEQAQYEYEIDRATTSIVSNVEFYEDVLRNVRSLLTVDSNLSYQEWGQYVTALAIEENYPGIEGIGFIEKVSAENVDSFEQAVRDQGLRHFTIDQSDNYSHHLIVKYAEPLHQNVSTLGFDLHSNPVLLATAVQARDSGISTISSRIELAEWLKKSHDKSMPPADMIYSTTGMEATPSESHSDMGHAAADRAPMQPDTHADMGAMQADDHVEMVPVEPDEHSANMDAMQQSDDHSAMEMGSMEADSADMGAMQSETHAAMTSVEPSTVQHGTGHQSTSSGAGFFIFQPVYQSGRPLNSTADRRAALIGWVYALISSHELMSTIIGLDSSLIHFEIFDGQELSSDTLLFVHAHELHHAGIVTDEQIVEASISGRIWSLQFGKLPKFLQANASVMPNLMLAGGGAISLLLFGLTWFMVRDVVQRREASQLIAKSEEKFSNLFHHSNDAIFMHDADGQILDVNQRALSHFHGIELELLALKMHDLFYEGEYNRVWPLLQRLRETGSVNFETVLKRTDGTPFAAELSASSFELNGQQRIQTIIRDITKRKHAQHALETERSSLAGRVESRTAALREANEALTHALTTKDEFLATMSHELRTPLAAMLGQTGLLEQGVYGQLSNKQSASTQIIRESGEHLLALISDILELSTADIQQVRPNISPLLVEDLCHSSIRMVEQAAQKKGIRVQYTKRQDGVVMHSDERRLKQILANLLSNAIKFTPTGGRVGIVSLISEDFSTVHFVVWDTGIGIAKADHRRLFQPFVQVDSRLARKHEGAGLGLAVVARFVKLLGGRIVVDSEVGKGSRFIISLPTYYAGAESELAELGPSVSAEN